MSLRSGFLRKAVGCHVISTKEGMGGAMTGAMRDALELIRSLKEQYPDETEDQLISRFHKELEADQALRRALMRDVFKNLLEELGEGKPPSSKV